MSIVFRRIVLLLIAAIVVWLVGPLGRLAVISGLLLFGPGYVIDRLWLRIAAPTPFIRPTIWLGLSVSLIALLYQWVTALNLALTAPVLAVLAVTCALGIGLAMLREPCGVQQDVDRAPVLALGGLLALTLGLRFYQIRALVLPNWVDSVHHALMVRVAIERGQAPLDLRPYLPVTQLPYHWGYHVVTAASAQLSNLSVPEAMLWQGQLLSTLHVLSVAALAAALWRKPWAGVVAGVVTGLVSLMPAFYTSWGRYTQLLGLLLLPPLAICWHALLHKPSFRQATCVALLLAGLQLIHIRVLIFALVLLASMTVVWGVGKTQRHGDKRTRRHGDTETRRQEDEKTRRHGDTETHLYLGGRLAGVIWSVIRRQASTVLLRCAGACVASAVLTAPWLWLLVKRQVRTVVAQPAAFFSGDLYGGIDLNLLWSGPNRWLVALALTGALLGIRNGSQATLTVVLWVAGLFALANPQVLPYLLPVAAIPLAAWAIQQKHPLWALAAVPLLLCNPLLLHPQSSWLITNDVIVIALFVPLGVLIGGLVSLLWHTEDAETRRHEDAEASPVHLFSHLPILPRFANLVLVASVIAAAVLGAWSSRDLIRPSTVLATPDDLAAITWVAHHTPPDARFLIGAAPWLGSAARGVDGGWWLLPLAGRWVSTPPVLFVYGPLAEVQQAIDRDTLVIGFQPQQTAELYRMLKRERIDYVYLTKQSGAIAQAFGNTQHFPIVYQGEGVRILAVPPQP